MKRDYKNQNWDRYRRDFQQRDRIVAEKITARLARERASVPLEEAAKRAHYSVAYLRHMEKHGGVPWVIGERLARLYGCCCQVFLYS